jgi:predicted  nucleic acid-binding Zn-ribbon protein
MTEDLNDKNDRLRDKIDQLVESHPELEETVRDIASKQPRNGTPQQVQANLQERARAIIELQPELEHIFED